MGNFVKRYLPSAFRCRFRVTTCAHLVADVVDHKHCPGVPVGVVAPVLVQMVHWQQACLPVVGDEEHILTANRLILMQSITLFNTVRL